jgi:hypothetical protein
MSKQLSATEQAARRGASLMEVLCASGNRCHLPIVALMFALAAEEPWSENGPGQSRDIQREKCAVECRSD